MISGLGQEPVPPEGAECGRVAVIELSCLCSSCCDSLASSPSASLDTQGLVFVLSWNLILLWSPKLHLAAPSSAYWRSSGDFLGALKHRIALVCLFYFGTTPTSTQGLLLVLCLEMAPGRLWG